MSNTRQFEYQMLPIDGDSAAYKGYIQELNAWGREGWEVCGAVGVYQAKVVFFLKREVRAK